MTITRDDSGAATVFLLDGRLDTGSSPQLEAQLKEFFLQGQFDFKLDMQKITYLSSAGLRVLLGAQKKVNATGGSMVILGAAQSIKEIFDVTGFSGILTIE